MVIMGLIPGAVTPLGLLSDEDRKVELYLDEAFRGGLIGIHPNDNTTTVWLKTEDLAALIEAHGNPIHMVCLENE